MCYRSNSDDNLLSLKMVFRYFKVQPRFHARTQTSHFKSTLVPSVQVTKLPTTFFMFLRVPLTHLDRWLAFFTKFPRDYRCSQTNWLHIGYRDSETIEGAILADLRSRFPASQKILGTV